jgi:hypothetical protein
LIDPLVSVAFSMYSNPGAYALLLGSGISRSAGIPTGYEITLDLVRKVAGLEGADPEPDPSAWYQKTHGEPPNYSRVLGILGGTHVERNALLRSYFEPTEQEAAEGVKTPRAAHRAVAELMAAGYIRVVITTNFDRLLEKSAEAARITPIVISTADVPMGLCRSSMQKPPSSRSTATISIHALRTQKRNSAITNPRWQPCLTECWMTSVSLYAAGLRNGTVLCAQRSLGR